MNYIELLINEPATASLDLNQDMDIALQYSIADIKDISKRNAAYSKTLVLPGTKTNNYWFGNLFDVNADFSMFNPNKKTAAKLLVNTETVIDGFLQLRKIVKLNNTDPQGNEINYECVIYNNAVDLMAVIGESPVSDLDMSEFGHTFSNVNVKDSWSHTWEDGYVYPMVGLDNGDNSYTVENFYPGIYYKTLLDTMVRQAGFGWTGSLYTNPQFQNEIITYVSDGRPKITDAEIERRKLYVGRTQSINLSLGIWQDGNINNPASATSTYTQFPSIGANARLNDETSSPFYDNDNHWNTTTWEWTLDRNGKFTCGGAVRTQLRFTNNNPSFTSFAYYVDANYVVGLTTSARFTIEARVQVYQNGSWNSAGSTWASTKLDVLMPITIAGGATVLSNPITITFDGPERMLYLGQKVRLIVNAAKSAANPTLFYSHQNPSGGGGSPLGINVGIGLLGTASTGLYANYFFNKPVAFNAAQNDYIDLSSFLPEKIKQKDLLTDLIKRYNLFIQTDPENPKRLIFDTRPDFYNRGEVVDWTNKKDYGQKDEVELLSDLQYKLMIWSYKQDNDEVNKVYKEYTGDVYGQYKYYFDNDFVKGENRIESTFSPTPLVKTAFDAIVPAINPDQPKVQPRVLYYGGLRNCDGWNWVYQTPTGLTGSTESFSQYPYAGHFDDPIEPTLDLNFGTCKFYYYNDWSYITDNNMYNTYWSDYTRQIESGRLITSYFYLDEYDVRYIKDNFYTKIFILDSYYYVNKIIDYKPLLNQTTKVELIKIVDGITWKPKRTSQFVSAKPANPLQVLNEVVVGVGNQTNGGGGLVVGKGNVLGGKTVKLLTNGLTFSGSNKSAIIGSDNTNFGDRSFIVGDGNNIEAEKSLILGGDNNSIEASNVSIINATGIVATQSNRIYLGQRFVINTETGEVQSGSQSILPLRYYTEGSGTASGGTASIVIGTTDFNVYDDFDAQTGVGRILTGVMDATTYTRGEFQVNKDQLHLRLYDQPTSTNVSSLLFQNSASEGYATFNIVGTSSQTILNLDPSGANGNTFFKEQGTTNSAYGYVAISKLAIYSEVLDASNSNITTINHTGAAIEITPDAGTTNFIFRGTPAGYSTGQLIASGDALFKYDQTEWTSVGFDSSTLITKGYIDYLGLTSTGATTSKLDAVLAAGNTSSRTIQLEEGSFTYPSYTFQNFTQSGIYHSFQHPVTSRIAIAVSGATSAIFKQDGMAIIDGARLQGGLHFINDVDTGIFRSATNELSVSVGGLTAASFYVGSARAGIKTPVYSTIVSSNTSVTGTFTQSLSDANNYTYTLTGNTTFAYSNPTQSVYNFLVKAGTYSFTLASASNWQTVGATALGFTGSFVMSAIYDGTDMWVSTVRNYQSY